MGHIASADGLKVDPAKAEATVGMPTPANKTDLLGMTLRSTCISYHIIS